MGGVQKQEKTYAEANLIFIPPKMQRDHSICIADGFEKLMS